MTANILDTLEQVATDIVDTLVDTLLGAPEELNKTTAGRPIELPRDTYAHDDVQTEWWYYTGHLQSGERQFGFQVVFFKRRTDKDRLGLVIPMRLFSSVNYYAHFAITDIEAKQFRYAHRRSINGSLPAGAAIDRHKVWLDNWSVCELGSQHIVSARMGYTELNLSLKPVKPLVKHGLEGLSYKETGEASYYLSYPRMMAEGELVIANQKYQVTGTAWMDHEFGTWTMKEKIQGWDWFAIQLDDHREIMAFQLRDKDGKPTRFSEVTLIETDGSLRRFSQQEFSITPLGSWTSQVTGTVYPSGWQLNIPTLEAELQIEPVLRAQELDTRGSTMVIYWEGATTIAGRLAQQPVTGRSYVELVGYDRSHERVTLLDYFLNELHFRGLGWR
ncbi:MAG: lipocalin-like domain-containing protein [Acidobacteriota bacterium]